MPEKQTCFLTVAGVAFINCHQASKPSHEASMIGFDGGGVSQNVSSVRFKIYHFKRRWKVPELKLNRLSLKSHLTVSVL